MSRFRGMVVRLRTDAQCDTGTDDHLYIGVVGPDGGREFPLPKAGFNDFEGNSDVKNWLETVQERYAVINARKPERSTRQQRINLGLFPLGSSQVHSVHIRKRDKDTEKADGAFKFSPVQMTLYDTHPDSRIFSASRPLSLGHEYGQRVWLAQEMRALQGLRIIAEPHRAPRSIPDHPSGRGWVTPLCQDSP